MGLPWERDSSEVISSDQYTVCFCLVTGDSDNSEEIAEYIKCAGNAFHDLVEALERMERVVVELYPGHAEPDSEHLEEYKAVWGAVINARAALKKAGRG